MGYADRFYYGQCKLEIKTSGHVLVTDVNKRWEGDGNCTFMLPGTQKYTISVGDKTEEIYADYGDYILKEI